MFTHFSICQSAVSQQSVNSYTTVSTLLGPVNQQLEPVNQQLDPVS